MRFSLTSTILLFLIAGAANAAPVLSTGTPGNSLLFTPTGPSPRFGTLINFDALTPNSALLPGALAAQGVSSLSSPDGLTVLPFSTQSFPNELFDASTNGSADLSILLAHGTNAIGIGIADSDPVTNTLQALNSSGAVFGSAFTINVAASGDPSNPGNGYYVVSDTAFDIFGLKILQASGNANYSGLAIDDLQVAQTPEPASLALLGAGSLLLGGFCSRKRRA